ncbi:MAG: pantoate--beta-alanine ligase [Candidatus Omnitrophota bacterium]
MITTGSINTVRRLVGRAKKGSKIVGFVPTMGALHQGHISLIRRCRRECDFVLASIFVNPIQFGPKEDYSNYPRRLSRDKMLLKREEVDVLFLPSVGSFYAGDFSTFVFEERLSKILCGKSRPGHFKGVLTVVAKLFNVVLPDKAYFGQKDYQQSILIRKMANELNIPVKIEICPIVREKDGLAISSRNEYLNPKERLDALCLFEATRLFKKLVKEGRRSSREIIKMLKGLILSRESAKIGYVSIIDASNLKEIKTIKGRVALVLAVKIGKTRLIDNCIITA